MSYLQPLIKCISFVLSESDWFDVSYNDENQGKIHLSIKFTSKESLEDEKDREVRDAYFPLRPNSRFILYQDAETPQLPQVRHSNKEKKSKYITV